MKQTFIYSHNTLFNFYYTLCLIYIPHCATRHPCLLDEHHSFCEQAIQCHFAVYDTSVTAVGNTERCDEGVDQ